jgi:hypothetical protein
MQPLWKVRLTAAEAPALQPWLAEGRVTLGDLVRDPDDRGQRMQPLWKVRLTAAEAPGLREWLAAGAVTLGGLFRDPDDRDRTLEIVPLMLLRDGASTLGPDLDVRLQADDELLLAGEGGARRALERTMLLDATAAFVVAGEVRHESWLWRRLSRR